MSEPVLLVTAHFVDPVETRLEREFDPRRKEHGARFTLEELLCSG
jgi:hypothetical protein